MERPRLTAMGRAAAFLHLYLLVQVARLTFRSPWSGSAWVESLMALSMKKSPFTCGASTPMLAQKPWLWDRPLGWRDHANAFAAVLGLSSSRRRQGVGVAYFKTKLWAAEPSTANASSVACHPSPAKSSVVNPSIASFLVTQLPPSLLYSYCRCHE